MDYIPNKTGFFTIVLLLFGQFLLAQSNPNCADILQGNSNGSRLLLIWNNPSSMPDSLGFIIFYGNTYAIKKHPQYNDRYYTDPAMPANTFPTGAMLITTTVTIGWNCNNPNYTCPYCNNIYHPNGLPVELTTFKGELSGKDVNLQWSTAMEKDNAYFAVERSFEADNFQTIGTVPGAGESSETRYYIYNDSRVVEQAASNTAYYRLRQVGTAGESTYSKVIPVSLKTTSRLLNILNIMDWEAQYNLRIYYYSPGNDNITVYLYDYNGTILGVAKDKAEAGYNEIHLPIPELSAGVYLLSLTNGAEIITRKLIRQ